MKIFEQEPKPTINVEAVYLTTKEEVDDYVNEMS